MPEANNPAPQGRGPAVAGAGSENASPDLSVLDMDLDAPQDAPKPPRKADRRLREARQPKAAAEPAAEASPSPPAGDEIPLDEPEGAPSEDEEGHGPGDPGQQDELDGAPSGEASEADDESAESTDDEPRYARADTKTRLSDGRVVEVGELKRVYGEVESIKANLRAEVGAYQQQLHAQYQHAQQLSQQYEQQLAQVVQQTQGTIPPEPDPALEETDPFAYQQQWIRRDRAIKHWHANNQRLQQMQQQRSAQELQQFQAVVQAETEQLFGKVPELRDAAKQKSFRQEVHGVAAPAYGFAPEELDAVTDHRALLVLKDAIAYRKLMAGRKSQADLVKQKAAKAPPVQRPAQQGARLSGAARETGAIREQLGRLRQTGSAKLAETILSNPKFG